MGCVYTLGHQPGSKILNNYCSDVQSYNYGGWAFYTDEGSRDELFESNVATRTKCAGHHQHYGTDNVLRNKIHELNGDSNMLSLRESLPGAIRHSALTRPGARLSLF